MSNRDSASYSALDDEWEDKPDGSFRSKIIAGRDYQRLIFNDPFRDGAISSEIIVHSTSKGEDGREYIAGSLIFRFQDRNNYYYAGIGGFGGRFFLAKVINGQFQSIVTEGHSGSLRKQVPYAVMIRCYGNSITLSHNGITQLSVLDDSFNSGPWGIQSYRSAIEFKSMTAETVRPTCFVIMPFAPEFNPIYEVIESTVIKAGYDCVRADQRYLSGPIIDDITEQIDKADLVIADFTDRNANVFFEAGYAAALRKPLVQIAQSVSDLPFDVGHRRTIAYNTKILGDRKLAQELSLAIQATAPLNATRLVGTL